MKPANLKRANEIGEALERLAAIARSIKKQLYVTGDGNYRADHLLNEDFKEVLVKHLLSNLNRKRAELLKEMEAL